MHSRSDVNQIHRHPQKKNKTRANEKNCRCKNGCPNCENMPHNKGRRIEQIESHRIHKYGIKLEDYMIDEEDDA